MESATCSWPTNSKGRARMAATDRRVLVVLSLPPKTGLRAWRGEGRLHDNFVEMLENVLLFLGLAAPPRRDARAASVLRRAGGGTGSAERRGRPGFRSARSRARWRSATLPARAASTRPGTPRKESLRNSSGSQKVSSTRRKITSTGCKSFERLQEDAAVAHGEIAAFDQRKAEITREVSMLKVGLVVRSRA